MSLSSWGLFLLLGATLTYQVYGQSFNTACTTSPQCSALDPQTECGDNGRCRCFLGYYPNGQSAPQFLCEKIVGSTCGVSSDCIVRGDPETICVDVDLDGSPETCECNFGFYLDGNQGLCDPVYNSECNVTDQCTDRIVGTAADRYYTCEDTDLDGSNDRCRCIVGAFYDTILRLCTSAFNSTCTNDAQCTARDSNLICSAGNCQCSTGYYPNPSNTDRCELVYGSSCSASSQCAARSGGNRLFSCVDTDNDGAVDSCQCGPKAYYDNSAMTCANVYDSACTATADCVSRSNGDTLFACVDTDNNGSPDKCRCVQGAYNDNNICKNIYNSLCSTTGQCTSRGDPNGQCLGNLVCRCKALFFNDASVTFCTNAYDSRCANDITCVARGDINLGCADTDSNGTPDTCRCLQGTFVNTTADNVCVLTIGSSCATDSDCQARGEANSVCDPMSLQCACKTGYYNNQFTRRCERALGSMCASNADCTAREANSRCSKFPNATTGVCACQSGYLRSEIQPICLERKLGIKCRTDSLCRQVSSDAVCSGAFPGNPGSCNCGPGTTKDATGTNCVRSARLGGICEPTLTICDDANAECVLDGSVSRTLRCQCKDRYVETGDFLNNKCAFELTSLDDPWCKPCEDNDGFCFDLDGDGKGDGCLCPASRSGQRCEKNHVIVSCSNDTMTVCYQPHDRVNLTTGMMLADEQFTEAICRGKQNDAVCGFGQYLLTLSLIDFAKCNTKRTLPTTDTFRFENTLAIQSSRDFFGQRGDRKIDVFCSYKKYVKQTFQGIGVDGNSGGGAGENKVPTISTILRNELGQAIPQGVALALGDMVRMDISLVKDGIYNAIRIKECTASNKPLLSGQGALRLPLLNDGCPAGLQTYFTMRNLFTRVSGAANRLRSGLVEVFRISRGTSLFLHCTLEVCLNEVNCPLAPCTPLRRTAALKSAAKNSQRISVVQEIRTFDPNEGVGNGGPSTSTDGGIAGSNVIILIAAFAGILLIAVVVISVLATKLTSRGKTAPEEEEELNEFDNCAIPRIDPDMLRP